MTFKFLFDECLSPALVDHARNAGHEESNCVRNLGWAGMTDWDLMVQVVAQDFTLVTNNAIDFRGDAPAEPGGHFANEEIHAGLICLNSEFPMVRERQIALFDAALDELHGRADLINHCLDISEDEHGEVRALVFELSAAVGQ